MQHTASIVPDCLQLLSSSSPLDTEVCLAMPEGGDTSSEKCIITVEQRASDFQSNMCFVETGPKEVFSS